MNTIDEKTFKQGLDEFIGCAPEGGWSDYWAMQQDWEFYKDSLCRDGVITQKQADSWSNPCTPETFARWQKRNGLVRRGYESKKSNVQEKGNKDIYTLDLTRIDGEGNEEGLDDMQAAQTFYDEDDAIKAAKELADSYKDDDDVVQVTVMAGEQEKPNGDIVGESFDIFTASSSDSVTTAEYREKAGYAKTDGLDYYAKGGKPESKKSEDTKVGKSTIMPKDTSRKQAGIKAYQTRLGEMGFKSNLHNNGDYTHDYVKEIGKIPGATVYVGTINNFQKNTQEYQYEAELYMENEKGIRSNIEYMPFAITDISDGMQRKMYFNRLNALIKKGTDFVNNHESSESHKKSEGIGDRIKMGIDYNMFMRMCGSAAYLDDNEDYWDALWEYYSEMGEIEDACEFFDNLFQYTAWCDADTVYDEYLDDKFKDESKSKEECIQAAIDDGDLDAYKHDSGNYLVIS